jgi:Tfp pilus assembly protein PilF
VRLPAPLPARLPAEQGATVTRVGLANHLLVRAEQELAKGDPQSALTLLERALELDPHRLEALVAAGVLHDRRGERGRARVLLDRAVDQGADDVVALSARGALELGAGSPFAARRYFEAAHRHGKSTMTAANLGAALLVLGEVQAARELLRSIADPSAPPELHANLAFAELQTGHADLARESLQRALAAGADARNPRLVALQRLIGVDVVAP